MHSYSTTKKALLAVISIFVAIFTLVFLSLLLQDNYSNVVNDPVRWLNELDSSVAFDILSTSAELLAAVLAIAILSSFGNRLTSALWLSLSSLPCIASGLL